LEVKLYTFLYINLFAKCEQLGQHKIIQHQQTDLGVFERETTVFWTKQNDKIHPTGNKTINQPFII
jgi:hypothetical protein